jgi:hypothetical protein
MLAAAPAIELASRRMQAGHVKPAQLGVHMSHYKLRLHHLKEIVGVPWCQFDVDTVVEQDLRLGCRLAAGWRLILSTGDNAPAPSRSRCVGGTFRRDIDPLRHRRRRHSDLARPTSITGPS